jgi:hypothetical protein
MRAQMSEPKDQRYPERNAGVIDAWGNHWYIATHQEDLTAEELRVRTAAQGESIRRSAAELLEKKERVPE